MQLSSLLPVLALLAAPLADARDHGSAGRRNLSKHAQHVRVADNLAKHDARHAELAAQNPRAVRKVKRGANGCRVRGSTFTASSSSAAATSAASSAPAASSAVASAAASPSAAAVSAGSGQNWAEPSAAESSAAAEWSATPAQSSAAAATSSAASSNSGSGSVSSGGLTPNGIKAGASGTDTLDAFGSHISWFWNYGPTSDTSDTSHIFMPTLWGNGNQGDQDWSRLSAWKSMDWTPQYVQGFYEPDCLPPMSSAIDPYVAAPLWNTLIAPYRQKGSLLVSPGMCKQADEDWLTPFKNAIGDSNMWDITSIHINKVDMAGARKDIDHYWNTYGKPIWVTEFACVDDSNGFTPCTDQGQINTYINDIVDLMESDSRIYAYSMSEGMGLGDVWPPWKDGALTESGRTYLNAISKYH